MALKHASGCGDKCRDTQYCVRSGHRRIKNKPFKYQLKQTIYWASCPSVILIATHRSDAIMDVLTYYVVAGSLVGNDMNLLSTEVKLFVIA